MMPRTQTTGAVLLLVLAAATHSVSAQSLHDDFEFWVPTEQYGSAQLSSDQHHSGIQSLKLASTGGGQRYIYLTHAFPQATKGTLSVWFYDTAPGLQTLYSSIYAFDSATPFNAFKVGVADWNGSNYIWYGPGLSETPTSVTRTLGWHHFVLRVAASGFEAVIDNVVVGTVAGDFTFDTVQLILSGPVWRPDATFYFDDFTFIESLPLPGPPGPGPSARPRTGGGGDARRRFPQ
jgi:hypothetical protein